jgi:hypothetical protein
MSEIREEVSKAFHWRTYVRRYSAACLLTGGIFGLVIGRAIRGRLSQNSHVPEVHLATLESTEPSALTRMAEMAVASVFAHLIPSVSAKVRQFLAGDSSSPERGLTKLEGLVEDEGSRAD